jgi:hypothetical protein
MKTVLYFIKELFVSSSVSKALSLLLLFFTFISAAQAQSAGPDGSFNYKVDITVPPGTAGMQPQLALVYNSNAGNGLAGMGWMLSGIPVITRDAAYPINYDGNDRYTGPGGRLVLVDAAAKIYHSEDESWSRFEGKGSMGDSFEYWIETKPDGTKYYYGQNTNSFIRADGKNSARVWALCKVEDLTGNFYTVDYEQNEGEYYPLKITYTQGNGLSRFRTIDFVYDKTIRADYCSLYIQNSKVVTRYRLKEITVKVDVVRILGIPFWSKAVRSYKLDYAVTTADSKIVKIDEFGSENNQINSFSFNWTEANASLVSEGSWIKAYEHWWEYANRIWPMDVNGDGKMDIVLGPSSAGKWYVLRSTGTGFVNDGAWLDNAYGNWWEYTNRIRPMDVNGDGKMDIVLGPSSAGKWYVLRSTVSVKFTASHQKKHN